MFSIDSILAGLGMNIGGGILSPLSFLLIYFLFFRARTTEKMTWASFASIFFLVLIATGLSFGIISWLMPIKIRHYASVVTIISSGILSYVFLLGTQIIKKNRLGVSTKLYVIFLVAWLLIGGSYISSSIDIKNTDSDLFFFVLIAPVLFPLAYKAVATAVRWIFFDRREKVN